MAAATTAISIRVFIQNRPLFIIWAAALVPFLGLGIWVLRPVSLEKLTGESPSQTVILDRKGKPVGAVLPPGASWRKNISPGDISPKLHQITLAAEDHRFHRHLGIDPIALARALSVNLRHLATRQGGSTLTQQTAGLWHPRGRTLWGKGLEALDALRLELWLSKKEILAAYLTLAPWANRVQGIGLASQVYFDKDLSLLSQSEICFLMAIPSAPTRYNPWKRPDETRARALRIASRVRALHPGSFNLPDETSLALVVPKAVKPAYLAPHFRNFLEENYSTRMVGQAVRTTLDGSLQEICEQVVREQVRRLASRNLGSAAALVVENETGRVRAWVGGADFDETNTGQLDLVDSPRQPGSSLKPFTYLLALESGFGAQDALPDVPMSFASPQGTWLPQNYGRRFYGPVRLREALANSLNLPAVYTLEQIGAPALYEFLTRCGVGPLTPDPRESGLGLTLGNTEIRLWHMAMLYRMLARGGLMGPFTFFEADAPAPSRRVASPEAVALITDILSDDKARRQGFGVDGPYHPGFPVALKTGTSQSYRDNLILGYQAGHTVAVWAGNPDRRSMHGVSGVTGAGPIFAAIFREVQKRWPRDLPGGVEKLRAVQICTLSGMAPGPHCPERMIEKLLPGRSLQGTCTWHRSRGLEVPPQFVVGRGHPGEPGETHIENPSPGARYREDPRLGKRAQAIAFRGRGSSGPLTWILDGKTLGSSESGADFFYWPGPGKHQVCLRDGRGHKTPPVFFEIE